MNFTAVRWGNRAYNVLYYGFPFLVLYYPYSRYQAVKWKGPPHITEYDGISSFLTNSPTVTQHINPLGNNKYFADTRSVTFNGLLHDQYSGKKLSDAEILKRLCIGFWGGPIFGAELAVLRTFPRNRVGFDGTEKKAERGGMFMTQRDGRMDFVMEKGDQLFQAFQVLDMKVKQPGKEGVTGDTPSSYIDFGYGKSGPGSTFAGVHRFSVTRLPAEDKSEGGISWQSQKQKEWMEEDGGARVKVMIESYTCSPTPGKGIMLNNWTWGLHKTYSSMLFSNGVSAVVRGYGKSRGS